MKSAFLKIVRESESWFDYLDPLYYMTPDEYDVFWRAWVSYMFQGNIARFFAVVLLILALFFGAVKQRFGMGLVCFVGAIMFTYFKAFQMILG